MLGALKTDHPRKNGEHQCRRVAFDDYAGSPPQKRGTHSMRKICRPSRRITPAKTGNTLTMTQPWRQESDHPRKNGEHIRRSRTTSAPDGSPPQKRGTLCRCHDCLRRVRITPAKTGNTAKVTALQTHDSDHPRKNGEHAFFEGLDLRLGGSPPQKRGTRQVHR